MFKGKKTYITGALAVLTAVGAYLSGELALAETIQTVFGALMAMFIRSGVKSDTTNDDTTVAYLRPIVDETVDKPD